MQPSMMLLMHMCLLHVLPCEIIHSKVDLFQIKAEALWIIGKAVTTKAQRIRYHANRYNHRVDVKLPTLKPATLAYPSCRWAMVSLESERTLLVSTTRLKRCMCTAQASTWC